MLQEVQEFCSEQQWAEGIYQFLKAWDPQKLENLRGSPIKDYVVLVSQLKDWQERVSNMPVQLLTKGKLLLLSGHDVQAELGKCFLSSLHLPSLPTCTVILGLAYPPGTFGAFQSSSSQPFLFAIKDMVQEVSFCLASFIPCIHLGII